MFYQIYLNMYQSCHAVFSLNNMQLLTVSSSFFLNFTAFTTSFIFLGFGSHYCASPIIFYFVYRYQNSWCCCKSYRYAGKQQRQQIQVCHRLKEAFLSVCLCVTMNSRPLIELHPNPQQCFIYHCDAMNCIYYSTVAAHLCRGVTYFTAVLYINVAYFTAVSCIKVAYFTAVLYINVIYFTAVLCIKVTYFSAVSCIKVTYFTAVLYILGEC